MTGTLVLLKLILMLLVAFVCAALAIAFGLGGRKVVAQLLDRWYKSKENNN